MQILAGIYFNGPVAAANGQIDTDVLTFQNAVKTFGVDRYVGLTVGNENSDSPENIMNKVGQVRDILRGAGINTPVSTVHTWVAILNNNLFCNGDFVAANAHAYYDYNTPADQTGNWLIHNVVPMLRNTCPNKQIMITESGWPSAGNVNGAAIPSLENEASSLLNLNCACRDDRSVTVFAFEYDNSLWKGTDVERSFGLFDNDIPKLEYNGDILAHC
ncbi:hypothetical protein AGABI1DRAFT_67957 [Agaricus bisporus var. burnettii JB137-S8]|uniref:Glycoside hydrolase family 17 protein n=1 Tax=Agaricus bisporus var. burnettii (strain JB137-S8 / ATCC MYA-4627 / FGSC 10392) TaxID=597362 RepID=K5Y353_AGABU|nr:uncharacterized protein AGABI1DRAFT_67957 [Agaricus bisporus var. burnettii JB137-S8]EKM82350.1 hypothetical protein AGABI1DRAFT_67957 [Agaricus bisporus var. burnettii JB137-S8]